MINKDSNKKMGKKSKITVFILIILDVLLLIWLLLHKADFPVLNPAGTVALQERNLIIFAVLLAFSIVIPVFITIAVISLRYRQGSTKVKYTPEWHHNRKLEVLWWAIPSLVILILGIASWKSTRILDPYRPLTTNTKPLTIQVVALQWKWLFIYPEQNIATLNFVAFPEKTPVTFELTADAPMNSFWIPHLGGQIYAMSGMVTKTHLLANEIGEFPGSSAEISGEGFASMRFTAKATTQRDFEAWVKSVQQSPNLLTQPTYNALAKPHTDNQVVYYRLKDKALYNKIVAKFMTPQSQPTAHETHATMHGMEM